MNEDIEILKKIMTIKSRYDIYNNYFCWLYPFTNENIGGYYSNINFVDKDVLTITSSGDHVLNALLLGAKSVEGFDSNPLSKYFVELKIAAIKSINLEEFLLFFYTKDFKSKKYFLNKETYKKVRKYLNDDCKTFWDYLINNYSVSKILSSYLISEDYLNLKGLLKSNLYLEENNYYKLRGILNNKKVIYHDLNIKDIRTLNKKYDVIILSNVPDFIEDIYDKDALKSLKDGLNYISYDDSTIVLCYLYSNISSVNSNSLIYNVNAVNKEFSLDDYEYLSIKNTDCLEENIFSYLDKRDDRVLIKKKKPSK